MCYLLLGRRLLSIKYMVCVYFLFFIFFVMRKHASTIQDGTLIFKTFVRYNLYTINCNQLSNKDEHNDNYST